MRVCTLYKHVSCAVPLRHQSAHPEVRARTRRKALLNLANLEQPVALDDATELANEGDVLAHVPAQPTELGVLLDEPLHVADRTDVLRSLC